MAGESPAVHAFDVLASTPSVVRAVLEPLPPEVGEAPADGEWSPKDIVAHLASLERWTTRDRIERMIDGREIVAIDEHEVLVPFRRRHLAALLDGFAGERAHNVEWLRSLGPEEWARRADHPVVGPVSVAEVVNHKAFHDLEHLGQLAAMLAGPLNAARGAMRGL